MSIDPKKKRFEAYEFSRQSGDITYSNEEMEAKLSSEEGRKAFHTYLTGKYESMGSFDDWEAEFFPEYSKKKDSGELAAGSAVSSSAIEPTPIAPTEGEPAKQMDAKALLESQGVGFAPVRQAIATPEKVEPSYLEEIGMAQAAPESTAAPTVLQSAQYNDIILERQQDYIKAVESLPNEALSDPTTAFNLLNIYDDAKSLHDDPDTPDRIKGQIKASVISDASGLIAERIMLMEASLGEGLIDRYSDAKSALIEIMESGDPEMQVGGRGAQQWLDDYEMLLQSDPALAEYDKLVEKSYALDQSYRNIKNVNPEYFKDVEAKRTKQIMADVMFTRFTPVAMEQSSITLRAGVAEAASWFQSFGAFVGSVGNSYASSSGKWDWADRTADWSFRTFTPPAWIMEPSRTQRSVGTFMAQVGDYQVDVDQFGKPSAVRDKYGDIVFNEQTRAQVIDQFESFPDKYDVRYRMHLAPAISVAAHGVVQVLVTSRFAGLGRTAAAAKGITAGTLTARFAGQNYMQALEEFGPQHAETAARYAIGTAALQSAISIYVNPLEIKLNPRFNISPKTLKRVARDLDAGKSADVAIRNGFRGYTDDLAKTLLTYGKEIGKEGLEEIMEKAVDVGGRMIVRSTTDIRAEYDASAMAWVDAFTGGVVGAAAAGGLSVGARNMWQQEGLMIAYENKDRILPMVKQMHGEEAATKLSAALKAADKRIAGKKLDRNQKNAIVVEEYNKAIKAYEEEAETAPTVEATPVVQEEVQPQPAQAAPAPEPEVSRVEPQADVYQVLREESEVLLLSPGIKFYTDGGIEFTVEESQGDNITVRNGDTDQITTKSKREIQEAIRQQTRDRLSREFPTYDDRRINGIRRALADVATQRRPIEETTATPVAPALPPAQEAPAATTAAPTTVEPVVPTGAKVYTRQNIQQAEGIDGAEMGRLMDVVAEISPDMQVQVFENNADMQAAVGQSGNAFVSEDGKTIYISKESASIDKIHEVMHPIVVAAEMRSPGTIERFYGEIFSTMPENVRNDIEAFIAQAGYAQMEAPARQEEAVVEFLARLADGRYDESILRDQTFVGKIVNFFNDIFQKLGIVNPPSDVESLKAFAAKVVKAVKSGSTISFDRSVTQPAATATQPEAAVEEAPPEDTSRGVVTQGVQEGAEGTATEVANSAGIMPKNFKDLYNINRKMFGQNRAKSFAAAVVMDRMIGSMASRAGISKSAMYGRINFQEADPKDIPSGVLMQVEAWHGSPHEFDRFSTDRIGTGEGVQAFGWGLYFSNLRDIAEWYAENLFNGNYPQLIVGGKPYMEVSNPFEWESEAMDGAAKLLTNLYSENKSVDEIVQDARDWLREDIIMADEYETPAEVARAKEAVLMWMDALDKIVSQGISFKVPKRSLYKVSLHRGKKEGEYSWLEWDTPISPSNQAKIRALKNRIPETGDADIDYLFFDEDTQSLNSGADVYRTLTEWFGGSQERASRFLLEADIDGVEYPAQSMGRGTRDTARGFNYVVFDENAIEIEEVIRWQRDAEKAQGAAMLGMDGQAVIYALTDPNVSTPLHEMAHVFEHYLTDAERKVVRESAGTKDWDVSTSEYFARGFERYLAEGFSPTKGLQKVFDKFKQWLTDIYNGVFGSAIDVPMNDQMRTIYASMLGPDVVANAPKPRIKPRITDDTLDPVYYRAKKWMREEMDQIPSPGTPPRTKADIVADAVGTYGITPGQADVMYDVLLNSPDAKNMGIPAGFNAHRKGIVGLFDKIVQLKKEGFNASQGLPITVLQGIEKASGETEAKVALAIRSHERITKLISELKGDEAKRVRELADRFMDGTITTAEIATIPDEIYRELFQMRTWIDEMTSEIISHSNFSDLRQEILSTNIGSYVSRVFAAHLSGKYQPTTKAIETYLEEYRRRNYETIAAANPTLSGAALEDMIATKGRQSYKDLLAKHQDKTTPVKGSRMRKPTGQMKERMQFPGRASKFADDKNEGKYAGIAVPIDRGRNVNSGDPDFDQAFAESWDDVRADRMREAYYSHQKHSKQYTALATKGERAIALARKMGIAVPGVNPLAKENLRAAVEDGTPIRMSTVAATSLDAIKYNELINDIQAGVAEIRQSVDDRVQLDMDAIAFGYEIIDRSEGFRKYEHLSIGERAILGELSPLDATVITMSNMARYYALTKYYRNLRAEGEGEFLFRYDDPARPEDFNKKIPGTERGPDGIVIDATTEALSPLAGMYTTPEIYDMITNFTKFSEKEYRGTEKALHLFTGLVNVGKTVWAPFTQSRNVMTNTDIVIRNGWAMPWNVVLAFGYVPADVAYRIITRGKRITTKDTGILAELKQMSDAFQAAMFHNFGNPRWMSSWYIGSNAAPKMNASDYGFDATDATQVATFNAMRRDIEAAMKRQEPRSTIVTSMVGTYGVTPDNARKMYADMQRKTFRDEMTDVAIKMANNGVLGTNVNLRVIQEHFDRVSNRDEATAYIANHLFFEESNPLYRAAKEADIRGSRLFKWPSKAYSFGDDLFKVFGYLRERANYSDILFNKPYHLLDEIQQAEVDDVTMEIVKNTIHNYDRIGKFGKYLSNDLFLAQFIAFRIESFRIAVNQLALGKREIAKGRETGNTKMIKSGAMRLAGNGLMFVTNRAKEYYIGKGLYYGAGAILQGVGSHLNLFEDDDEKDKELKKMMRSWLPSYMKYHNIVPSDFSGPEEGKVTLFPMSPNSPFGDFQKAMVAADLKMDGLDDITQSALAAAYILVDGFDDPKISVATIGEIYANEDVYGNKIYLESTEDFEGDSPGEKWSKIFSYAMRRAGPGFVSQLGRLGAWDWLPDTEFYSKFKKPVHAEDLTTELVAGISGYRPFVIDIYDNFHRRLDRYYTEFGEEGTQGDIYKIVKSGSKNIGDEAFEGQIKEMVEREYNTLRSLHDAYRLPVNHGLVLGDKMREKLLNKPGAENKGVGQKANIGTSGGRHGAMILDGNYRTPNEVINKHIAKHRKNFPDYDPSEALLKWLEDFQAEKRKELEALKK